MFRIEASISYEPAENCHRIRCRVYLTEKSFYVEDKFIPTHEDIFDFAWKDIGEHLKDAMKEESYV